MRANIKYRFGRRLSVYKARGTGALHAAAALIPTLLVVSLAFLYHVDAVADLTAPVLTAATVTDGAIRDTENPSNASTNVSLLDLQASDDLSGASAPIMTYTSPSGKQTVSVGSNGVDTQEWLMTVQIPQYAEAGVWKPTVYMQDYTGNKRTYTDDLLHTLGYDLDLTLTGQGDTTDPSLTALTRTNPGTLDVTSNPVTASFDVVMTDNQSGLGIPTLAYTSPSGNQNNAGQVTCYQADGATATGATYQCNTYFQQYSETGTWTPDLTFTDWVGNTVHLTNAQLLARGIDARVVLTGTSDTTPPTVSNVGITFANPPSDNIPYGGAALTIHGTVTDNLSGLNGTSAITYTSPSGLTAYGSIVTYDNSSTFQTNLYLPPYAEGGTWTPSIYVQDPATNSHTYSAAELAAAGENLAVTVTKNVTETAAPGGTVTSDYEHNGATTDNPVEASVTTPTGGPISIVIIQSDSVTDPTNGYTFFDRQLNITAPTESSATPLTLDFQIDASKVPAGESATTLQITRNGTIVPACTDQTTAVPDPCVFSRQTLGDGDIEVKIHTTTASAWASGFPTHVADMNFVGFVSGTKAFPAVNKVQAGQVVTVSMQVKDVPKGTTQILAAGQPTSQQVNCSSRSLIDNPEAAVAVDNAGTSRKGNGSTFDYSWRTDKKWNGTCRVLTIGLIDGSSKQALFKF